MTGAGEVAILAGRGVSSPSPELLFSLGIMLPSRLALLSLSPVSRAPSLPSGSRSSFFGLGVRQMGTRQNIPVKLFSSNGFRCHFRQGAPVRSSARRPALMAPWFALGPSLCGAGMSLLWSAVPSSLSRGFFFGPGFPLGFGKTSPIWFRLLLLPGLGPGMPFLRGVGAAGVEAASEALSTEEGGATGSADVEEGDALSLLWFSLLGFSLVELSLLEFFLLLDEVTLLGNRLRRFGASLRTTALFDRSDFVDRPFDEEVGVVVTAGMVVISPGSLCFLVLLAWWWYGEINTL